MNGNVIKHNVKITRSVELRFLKKAELFYYSKDNLGVHPHETESAREGQMGVGRPGIVTKLNA